MMPIIDELSKKYNVLKVDVGVDEDIAAKYNVNSLPTIIFIENGKEIGRINGMATQKMILDKINEIIKY